MYTDVPLQVVYSEYADQLGVTQEGWNMVAIVKFTFYYDKGNQQQKLKYLMLPDVVERTDDWQVIGDL